LNIIKFKNKMKKKLTIEKFRISKLTNSSKIFGGNPNDGQGETILGTITKPTNGGGTRPTQVAIN
jgi:hypothetical protein